jgi:hypothetical protein
MSTTSVNQNSTSRETIAFIHAEAESQRRAVEGGNSTTWDCCTREDQVIPEYATKRKSWADAAHEGNWGKILQVRLVFLVAGVTI